MLTLIYKWHSSYSRYEKQQLCSTHRSTAFTTDILEEANLLPKRIYHAHIKVTFPPAHAVTARGWGKAPVTPNRGTILRLVVSFTPRPLYLRWNIHSHPLNRRPGVLQWRGRLKKKISPATVRNRTTFPWSSGPYTSQYTDCATPAPFKEHGLLILWSSGSRLRVLLGHSSVTCDNLLNYTASYARVSTVTYWREHFCPWQRRVPRTSGLTISVLSKA
jgi:hypothetical protein